MSCIILFPVLRHNGYKRILENLGLPKSHYFIGEDSLGSLNQIHKRYLSQTGWIESKNRNESVRNGVYIPWTSYAFLYWFENRSIAKRVNDYNILEFGSGASTIYWSSHFKTIYTIETDHQWFELVKKTCLDLINVNPFLLYKKHRIDSNQKDASGWERVFDIDRSLFPEINFQFELIDFELILSLISKSEYFFIDGGPRNLYMHLIAHYADLNSIVIVDNSDQYYTLSGREELLKCGYKEIVFNSLGPLNHSAFSTSVFVSNFESL